MIFSRHEGFHAMFRFHLVVVLFSSLNGFAAHGLADSGLPNVIVILTDDQGWGDLSLHGNSNLKTPNLDTLAQQGSQFSNFYVCPVCSPTRAEFLTGRWHPRCGVRDVTSGGERLDLDEKTIADVFKAAGYRTGIFGKWHNGTQGPYHPNARGFDEFYGFSSGHWGHYFSPMLEQNDELTRGHGYLPDDLTTHAMEFIRAAASGRPSFVLLTLNTPHSPMQVPDSWWRKTENRSIEMRGNNPEKEDLQFTRAALAMCENIDWNVGRLLRLLDELKIADETIVVFFCDNGPNSDRWNGGMRGRKGSVDEGGVRSPLFIRWPGRIASETVIRPIAAAVDILPTLAELSGIAAAEGKPLDGRSLVPLLNNSDAEWSDRVLPAHWNGKVSARNQRYRLDDAGRLYDIEKDPGQKTDVRVGHPKEYQILADAVQNYRSEILSELSAENRPLVIAGIGGNRTTLLPARDAIISGGLQRSSRHPNCSWITNWKSTDDRIQWDVQIAEDGDFEIEILYTCEAPDVGSVVQFIHGNDSAEVPGIELMIDQPAESPLIGAAEDRVPRSESLVRDFAAARLGTVRLSKGTSHIALKAIQIAGSQAMELRTLILRRRDVAADIMP